MGGQSAGPGDIAMAGGVGGIGGFAKDPTGAGEIFAEGEIIGGDVVVAAGEAFFGGGELVHEGEAEVMFFGGEIDFKEAAGVVLGGFPADLAAESGLIAGGLDGGEVLEKEKEDSFEEVPILGASGEEGAEPEFIAFGFIEVKGGEIAGTGGGDIEAKTEGHRPGF